MTMKQTVKPELKKPEMKEKYFAQHHGQKLMMYGQGVLMQPKTVTGYRIDRMREGGYSYKEYLLLTPLDQISDEDAIEVATLVYKDLHNWSPKEQVKFGKDAVTDVLSGSFKFEKTLEIVDFLRSRGYALPWNGHSVEELIEAGYCQLRKGGGGNG